MRRQGIIEPAISDWAASIVIVKQEGTIRLCVAYRRMNALSRVDSYQMPRIDELINRLGWAFYTMTLDVTKGYWQVPVAKRDRPKTAFSRSRIDSRTYGNRIGNERGSVEIIKKIEIPRI